MKLASTKNAQAFFDIKPRVFALSAHAAFSQQRVLVEEPTQWIRQVDLKLNELVSLPQGWDGYGGLPVSYINANFASRMLNRFYKHGLPLPSIVPGSDGTLQIEWHRNNYDIELDVLGVNEVFALRFDHQENREETAFLDTDFSLPDQWIAEMLNKRGAVEVAAG